MDSFLEVLERRTKQQMGKVGSTGERKEKRMSGGEQ